MIRKILTYIVIFFINSFSYAGNQQYEELKNETKQLMSQSVSDIAPIISSFSSKEEEDKWLAKYSKKLEKKIPNFEYRIDLLRSIHYEATRAAIEPELFLGLIMVESGFKKYAISSADARGLTQVMPFWVGLIGDKEKHNLFHTRTNLRFGATILKHYIDIEKGNLFRALGRYNGSLGKAEYPNAIFAAKKTLMN